MSPHIVLNDGNVVIAGPAQAVSSNSNPSSAVLHRSLHRDPLTVVGGQGSYLRLSDGRKIFDATGGAAVACIGHGHPRIQWAVADQMARISYAHSLFFSTDASEELCRLLCESTIWPPGSGSAEATGNERSERGSQPQMTRAYIVSSGSEAMEAALKLARQYFLELPNPQPRRTRFIARRESYHGITLGALGVGGHMGRKEKFVPLLMGKDQVSHVSPCNVYRGMKDGESEREYVARLGEELDREFERIGGDTVCAFIAEPVVGAALGCVPPAPGYFKEIERVCRKHGALLILDEVMSGMGRIGSPHAWQHPDINVVPDIQTIGKALGGGYLPVAGVLVRESIVNVLQTGSGAFHHGQTYQGHPVACRAAAEVQKEIKEKNLVENVKNLGELLGYALTKRLEDFPYVGNVRGKGLFWGIEFVKDKRTKEPFDPKDAVAMGVHEKGMEEPYNISLYPGTGTVDGKSGDHVLVAPAYDITREEIDCVVDLTTRVIRDFFAGKMQGTSKNGDTH